MCARATVDFEKAEYSTNTEPMSTRELFNWMNKMSEITDQIREKNSHALNK